MDRLWVGFPCDGVCNVIAIVAMDIGFDSIPSHIVILPCIVGGIPGPPATPNNSFLGIIRNLPHKWAVIYSSVS